MAVEITSWAELNAIRNDLSGDYELMNDLDSNSDGYDDYASENANSGEGWEPISTFTGIFNGNNYVISDLYINRLTNYQGLFGRTYQSEIKNIGLENINITGINMVGGIIGINTGNSSLTNSYATGNVNGNMSVGGLVGYHYQGQLNITNSYAIVDVTGNKDTIGGLIGYTIGGNIRNSYSIGSVTGNEGNVGGLVGYNYRGTITNSYSTGNVTGGGSYIGGLVGRDEGDITNSYSTGNVTGGGSYIGGLVGLKYQTMTSSYYNSQTSGQSDSGKGEGKTTEEMMKKATFTGWDFNNTWFIDEDNDYPRLRIFGSSLLDGIVSYYKLDETSGSTAYDEEGNNNGTNNGATINQGGKINQSYLFSNANGKYIDTGITPSSTCSVNLWIYPTGEGGVFGTGYNKSGGKTGWEGNYDYTNKQFGISFWKGNTGLGTASTGSNTIPINQWSMITLVLEEKDVKLYVNGTLKGTTTLSSISDAHSEYLKIGRDFMIGGGADTLSGNIDEFGVWNRALSVEEVDELFSGGDGLTYPFIPVPKTKVEVSKLNLSASLKAPTIIKESGKIKEVGKLDLSLSQKEPTITIDKRERVIYPTEGYKPTRNYNSVEGTYYGNFSANIGSTDTKHGIGTNYYKGEGGYIDYTYFRLVQRLPIDIPQNETIIGGKLVITTGYMGGSAYDLDIFVGNNPSPSSSSTFFNSVTNSSGGYYYISPSANSSYDINLSPTTINFLNNNKGGNIGIGAVYYESSSSRSINVGGFYLVLQTEILPVVVKPNKLPLTADLKPASLQYDSTIPQSKQELSSILKTPTILKTKDFEASKLDLSLSQKSPKFEVAKPVAKQNLNLTQKDVTLTIGGSTKPNKLPLTASLKSPSIVFGRTYLPETLNLSTQQKNIVTRGDKKFQIDETLNLTSAYKLPVVNEELTIQLEKFGLTTDLKGLGFTADWRVELNKALELRSSQLPLNYEMKVKRMVTIGGVEVLNEWTNIKKVRSYRIEDLIEDAIPKVNIELSRDVLDISPLRIGSTIEIFEGEQNPVRLFYGYITNKKPTNSGFEIDGLAETMKLLRGRINKVYTSSEDHHGENSEIAKDIIQRAGLVPEVVPTGTSEGQKIDEFRCSNASPFERLSVLQRAVNYQIRYDPINRRVYYEPRGFNRTNQFITTKYNTIGLPEWSESDDGMINDLLINGATTDTTKTESGIIGTKEGFEVDGIELTKVPLSVELIIDGDQKEGGSKDGSAGNYYWVDFEKKKIMPRTEFPNGKLAVVNYVWSAPSPVRITNNLSINEYGLYQEEYKLSDVTSVFDAEARCREIVANRSKPFTTGKIRVLKSTPVKVGDYIKVNDNFSKKPVNDFFVVRKVVNSYPSAYNEIELGDKEFRLEDDFIELEARVKRLEELLISNDDIVTEFIELGNEESFIKPRYFAIYTN